MPSILQHQSSEVTKMLLIGDGGTGKTGALFSLAEAGYNLRILDLDNGADILGTLARRAKPEVGARIIYETRTEKMKIIGGKSHVDGMPKQFSDAMNLLDHWKVPETRSPSGEIIPAYDLGKTTSWGPQDVLVIDSLTMLSNAAMRYALQLAGRPFGPAQIQDWGQAMEMIEGMLALLYSVAIKCNVIVISHIVLLGGDDNGVGAKGFPSTLGQKLPPKVGRYFNSIVQAKVRTVGSKTVRQLITQPDGTVEAKNPAPHDMPKELSLETGLAEFFRIARGEHKNSIKFGQPIKAALA